VGPAFWASFSWIVLAAQPNHCPQNPVEEVRQVSIDSCDNQRDRSILFGAVLFDIGEDPRFLRGDQGEG